MPPIKTHFSNTLNFDFISTMPKICLLGATSILAKIGQFLGFWTFWANVLVCSIELLDISNFTK